MANDLSKLYPLIPKLALAALRENAKLSALVNTSYSSRIGNTVHIPIPTPAVDYDITPGTLGTSTDISPKEVILAKNIWRGVNLKISDLERAQADFESGNRMPAFIDEAVRKLSNFVDNQIISAAVAGIGNIYGTGSTPSAMSDVTGTALKLNNTMCPIDGRHFVINPQVYANFSNVQGFIAADYRGQSNAPVISGRLGTTHNFDFFIDQNLSNISNTSGTIGTNATGSNNTAVVNGALSSGAESMAVDGAALTTGTLKKGQKFTFAGLNQEYTLTADATMVSGAATLSFAPFLQSAIADNTVITFQKSYKVEGIAFHPDCIALAWQDFDPIPSAYGVIVYDEVDPISGAKIRFKSYHQNNQTILELQVSFAVGIVRPEFGALLATYTGAGTSPV